MSDPFRVAFVAGTAPDKWASRWRERHPDLPLEVRMVTDSEQRTVLETGAAHVSFLRMPVGPDGLHVIPLYAESAVAVVSVDDELSLLDELSVGDLAGHQLVTDPAGLPAWAEVATVDRLAYPPMSAKDAVEVVAGGAGTVAVLPMSVARLHHRKDVVARPLVDGPEYPVGVAWRRDDEDPRLEEFIGIVRGRTANSSRTEPTPPQPKKEKAAAKAAAAAAARKKAPGKPGKAVASRRTGTKKKSDGSKKLGAASRKSGGSKRGRR